MKTELLISTLAQDNAPRWGFTRTVAVALAAGCLVAASLFIVAMGPRADFAEAVHTTRFLFKFVVTILLAILATTFVHRYSRPGTNLGRIGLALLIPPGLLICAVIAELLLVPRDLWLTKLIGSNSRFCLTLIPLLSVGPLAFLLMALRKGAPSNPGVAGAIAGLASSGIAATFYAANCFDDSPLFVAFWYPLAISIVVAAGYVAGRKYLRW
ncbi:NrsF family protein [Bradyrhizobium sp. SYSU BS000235]|uniref:NrsF family protein n=1 Tax=Bradyrhizobium sp. SYSU BS000235 TaxID=3411332 RepID=UPI003C707FE3